MQFTFVDKTDVSKAANKAINQSVDVILSVSETVAKTTRVTVAVAPSDDAIQFADECDDTPLYGFCFSLEVDEL